MKVPNPRVIQLLGPILRENVQIGREPCDRVSQKRLDREPLARESAFEPTITQTLIDGSQPILLKFLRGRCSAIRGRLVRLIECLESRRPGARQARHEVRRLSSFLLLPSILDEICVDVSFENVVGFVVVTC